MQPEVTLSIYDEATGEEKLVQVESHRFTIGRLPDNDLMLDDTNLSRRHAVIECFDGTVLISDCGSQNGTMVNGKPISGAVQLQDGDVITLGGVKEITVHLGGGPMPASSLRNNTSPYAPTPHPPANYFNKPQAPIEKQGGKTAGAMPSWLNAHVIAAAAVVLILLGAGLLLALSHRSGPQPKRVGPQSNAAGRQRPVVESGTDKDTTAAEQGSQGLTNSEPNAQDAEAGDASGSGADELDEVEKYALRVMRSISNDNNPTLPHKVVSEVDERVRRLQGSTALRDELRLMKQRGISQLAGAAKSSDLKLPLIVYAALAKMERDNERGDPVAVAQRMLPTLSRLRVIFSTELANDSLLIIAAYDQGPGGTTHPLQATMFELAKRQPDSPATIRTTWYLHDHQKLSQQSYELVLRFLAVGVVAQDPHKFGVDAEPLAF